MLGVELKKEEVVGIEFDYSKKLFIVKTEKEYMAKAIIIATGNKRNSLNIEGIKELEGKGVSYCAICDAFFYKNKDVAVIGNGKYALSELNYLKNIAKNVSLLTQGNHVEEKRGDNIEIIEKRVAKLEGQDKLEDIVFEDNTKKKIDGLFIALGTAGASDFGRNLGLNLKNNNIIIDNNMQTNMPGVFACGDCTGGLLQVSKAVYEGAKAGLAVINYIRRN